MAKKKYRYTKEDKDFDSVEFKKKVAGLDKDTALALLDKLEDRIEKLSTMQHTINTQESIITAMLETTMCPVKKGEILKSETGRHYLVATIHTYDELTSDNLSWHIHVNMCKKDGTRTGSSSQQLKCNKDGTKITGGGYGKRKSYRRLADI
ncbi:MAG: hypothetical protein KAS32_28205 [Candidatus Peribacteraceae bacterium]|nr:hypothetical protein [Candidatus Peribacteraceae bacterium]